MLIAANLAALFWLGAEAWSWYRGLLPEGALTAATSGRAVTFLGDSIAAGSAFPPGTTTYPELAGRRLRLPVHNVNVSGITLQDALEQEVHRIPRDTGSVVIYLGTNDLWPPSGPHPSGPVHVLQMRASYLVMLHVLKERGFRIYVVLLRDLSKMPGLAHNPGLRAEVSRWTNSWDDWAARQGVTPIDLRCFPDVNDPKNYFPDEIHPNLEGNRLLAGHVAQGILEGGVTCAEASR